MAWCYRAALMDLAVTDTVLSIADLEYPGSPHLAAAYRHGAQDFADKHGGRG